MTDETDKRSAFDEEAMTRAVAIGLPIVTVGAAAVVGLVLGPATALLVLAAGVLLAVIAIFWASIRVLSGDAEIPAELEALDHAAHGVDALSSRRKMLVRALKDLENERAVGKLDEADFEQIAASYREELKVVLRRIDESLAPHRAQAEELARAHLIKAGVLPAEDAPKGEASVDADPPKAKARTKTERRTCPKCSASNEPDAKFCKECATPLFQQEMAEGDGR